MNKAVKLLPFSLIIVLLISIAVVPASASHLDVTESPSDTWVKEPGIRLNLDGADPTGTVGFHTPYVFRFPDGTLRMYYDIVPFSSAQIRSATSTDGLVWTKETGVRLSGVGCHPGVSAGDLGA